MCEVLIHFVDRLPTTDPNYALNYCALDIITVCADGWPWSQKELTNPDWRIIKAPGLATSYLDQFKQPRYVNQILQRKRDWCFDSTQIPAAFMTYLQNNQVITLTATQVSSVGLWFRKHSTTLTQT